MVAKASTSSSDTSFGSWVYSLLVFRVTVDGEGLASFNVLPCGGFVSLSTSLMKWFQVSFLLEHISRRA